MDKRDRIIAELVDALDIIRRHAETDSASLHYIQGVCRGATDRCNRERRRDTDGYLVVVSDPWLECPGGVGGTDEDHD